MATQEEQVRLAAELKSLTDEWCAIGREIANNIRDNNLDAVRGLYEKQMGVKAEMDIVREKFLKEDNDMKH